MGTLSKLPELKKNQEQQKQQIEDLKGKPYLLFQQMQKFSRSHS